MKVIYQPKGKAGEYSEYALNLYSGCVHGCKYCYVPNMLFKGKEFYESSKPREGMLSLIEKDCLQNSLSGGEKISNVLMCFTSDPYQPIEGSITREALELLNKYKVPFTILTKGGMRASADFDLYGKQDCFASTLTFVDDTASIEHEPKAALFLDRVAAIKKAKEMGIRTWVSLEPVINPEETYKIINLTHEYVDLFKVGKLNYRKADVNWKDFGRRVIDLLESLSKDYYIKRDLQKYLEQDMSAVTR